jgi:hypothetical protein
MTDLSDYHELIARKRVAFEPRGLKRVPALNSRLSPLQEHVTAFALETGCAAEFLDTGLGKTFSALEFGRVIVEHTNKPVLMLAPLAVAGQHQREAEKFGIDAVAVREPTQIADPRVYITNYDRLAKFDASLFSGVILDECFAKGTEVDTPYGKKHIEDIQKGDYILNCVGSDVVSDVHRREVPYGVLVTISGTSFIASPNHPIFTQRGWVGAQYLRPGDHALATGTAMRLVRENLFSEIPGAVRSEILRDILFSEMADDAERDSCSRSLTRIGGEAWGQKARVAGVRPTSGAGRIGENYATLSVNAPGGSRQNICDAPSNEARTVRAWGQWSRDDIAASVDDGCSWSRMDSGISVITGSEKARIPNLLQDRLRKPRIEDSDRGGWRLAFGVKGGPGYQEGRNDFFPRVEGIEILKPRDHRLEQCREADGKLYFYDLGATRHPSYSVNGVLVHNSSILKSFTGKTTNALIQSFAATPFRLACSATPAPNDHMELGQHSAFLGAMRSNEMLSRWFLADQTNMGRYRLKHAAVKPFWDWVASWARAVSKPSDLGFSDEGYVLPPLNLTRHIVEADRSIDSGAEKAGQGRLFRLPDMSATSIHKEKRLTIEARADKIAALVAAEPTEPWVVWCDTDYEADALMLRIPDAVEVRGSHTPLIKELRLEAFASGKTRVLISKPSICGYGLNWQHCARMAFVGLSFSYESFYQAVRRCWRFGQTRPVDVHVACADTEEAVWTVVSRKAGDHDAMKAEMSAAMKRASRVHGVFVDYQPETPANFPSFLKRSA